MKDAPIAGRQCERFLNSDKITGMDREEVGIETRKNKGSLCVRSILSVWCPSRISPCNESFQKKSAAVSCHQKLRMGVR